MTIWSGLLSGSIRLTLGRMQLTVNGESITVPEGLTVTTLLVHLQLTEGPVAVELNREVVPRAEHAATNVKDGDVLELVHFVGGG
ncbi:MAG: sulfur carrier protein ThiS [Polyangiaceae bacterium]